jgi:hypothetical protein
MSILIVGAVTGLVALVCVVGLLISMVVWIVSAHRLTAGAQASPATAGWFSVSC